MTPLWIAGGFVGAAAIFLLIVRRWMMHWGATAEEITGPLPGDESVPYPIGQLTKSITILARPEHIFPWLVQMGDGRGGLYSYDWLDRLFGFLRSNSLEQIEPEFQDLKVGDSIPLGRGSNFPVTGIERNRYLTLSGEENGTAWSWQMALIPVDAGHTRFITRNRMQFRQTATSRVFMLVLELAAFIMTRKWMLNIKRLAERMAREPSSTRVAPNELISTEQ